MEALSDRPWGLLDFRVADPDGYYVRVTHGDAAATASAGAKVSCPDPGLLRPGERTCERGE